MLPIKPGSAGIPLPGIEAAVVNSEGRFCPPGEKGIVAIRRPFPGLTPTLWGEPDRYGREYWQRIPSVYYTGDLAEMDEDGYVWFAGRADEIIKIAAHRTGGLATNEGGGSKQEVWRLPVDAGNALRPRPLTISPGFGLANR